MASHALPSSNGTHESHSTPHMNPKIHLKIKIREEKFNTRVSYALVKALDAELASMYPDWDELVHPNIKSGHNPNHGGQEPAEQIAATTIEVREVEDSDGESIQGKSHDGTANYKDLKFFVAFDATNTSLGGQPFPVGCIALNPLPYFPSHHPPSVTTTKQDEDTPREPPTAEVKRMYVVPSRRGTGVASKLVFHAMDYAKNKMGMSRLVLETGVRQVASVKLYKKLDFTSRELFGDWVGAGVEDGGVSVAMEHWLK